MFNLTQRIRKRLSNLQKCLTKVPKVEKTTATREADPTESKECVEIKKLLVKSEQESKKKSACPAEVVVESLAGAEQVPLKLSISDFDVLSIYSDLSKLCAIERHLNLLYRPFTCLVLTRCHFNLVELNASLPNSSYEPNTHSALFVTRTEPTCSLKVYKNGSIYCQGYNYESTALGIRRFLDFTEHLGYAPSFNNPTFNVVNATFCVPFGIDLQKLCEEYPENCCYEPETQPFLTYNIHNWIIKLIIFDVGYVYVLMCSQPRYTQQAIARILPILYRHRAKPTGTTSMSSNKAETSSGDINFKLLWENAFQRAYQDKLKFN